MAKHKTKKVKRRNHKGGAWYNPMSWFSEQEDPNKPLAQNVTEGFNSAVTGASNMLSSATDSVTSSASSAWDSTKNLLSTDVNLTGSQPQQSVQMSMPTNGVYGGRRRRRMKGGKGALGLNYYATPVSDIKMASPNSWQYYANGTNQYTVKGGSRRRRSRKTRRHRKR